MSMQVRRAGLEATSFQHRPRAVWYSGQVQTVRPSTTPMAPISLRNDARIDPDQTSTASRRWVAAVLLYAAYTYTHVTSPLREEHESGFIERLRHFFRQDGNRFSYQYIQVAEQSSEVVGLVLSGWRIEMRHGSTPPLEAGSNGRRRTMNGKLMRSPCSKIEVARGSARAWCKVRSGRHASTTILKLHCMSLKGTHRH